MSSPVRSLSATLAVVLVAALYVVYQARMERPGPPRPAPARSAERLSALLPAPPTAREILDQAVSLDLRGEQMVQLRALDRLWASEGTGLQPRIEEAEREFSGFMQEARGAKGTTIQEVQQRSERWSRLSAELRERRQRHADAALGVLAEWQRQRLAQSRRPVNEGRNDEARRD